MPCILLAEQDLPTRNFLAGKLREAGYDVDAAHNGQEAILLLSIRRHDLIIADFELLGKNGLEVLREIRRLAEFSRIPFVLFTKVDPRMRTDNPNYDNLVHEVHALGAVLLPKTPQHLRNFPIQALVRHLAAAHVA
jgi:CheY-like chemotaxis protein